MTKLERSKAWNLANPERHRANTLASTRRIIHNPERLKRRRLAINLYYSNNREKVIASHKKWRSSAPWIKISDRCRSLIRNCIYGMSIRGQKMEALLGCTGDEFRNWISSLWEEGMTWENFGRGGWTLGHKKPVALFKDVLHTETGQRECFHWKNIQPEWERNNRAKHTRETLTEAQIAVACCHC